MHLNSIKLTKSHYFVLQQDLEQKKKEISGQIGANELSELVTLIFEGCSRINIS